MSTSTRPYKMLDWSTERWMAEGVVKFVPLRDVVFQHDVSLLSVLHAMQGKDNYVGGDYPFLVRMGDQYYIEDGHHRVAKALLEGRDCLEARVVVV